MRIKNKLLPKGVGRPLKVSAACAEAEHRGMVMFISHLSACFGLGARSFGEDCLIIVIKMGTSYPLGAQGMTDDRKFTSLTMQIIRPYPHPPSGRHFVNAVTTSWPPKLLILINECQRKEDISDIHFPIRLLFSIWEMATSQLPPVAFSFSPTSFFPVPNRSG